MIDAGSFLFSLIAVKALRRKGSVQTFLKMYHKALKTYREGLKAHPSDTELLAGLQKVKSLIFNEHITEEERQMRVQRASADPEVQAIMKDLTMQEILRSIESNPERLADYLRDPDIAHNIETLIAAGILRMG